MWPYWITTERSASFLPYGCQNMAVFQPCARFWTCSAQLPWLCLALWSFTINVHNLVLSYCCSAAQSCLTLCDAMDSSTPGSHVLHCLLEFAQTPVHWVGDAIQQSHPLMPLPLLPSIFPMNIQGWFPLGLTGLIFCCPKDSWVFLSTTIQKYQFFGAQLSLWSNSHLYTWLLKKRIFDYIDLCRQSVVCFLIQCLGLS